MSERAPRGARIAAIDQMMREIGWYVQKRSAHTLARPEIDLTLPQMVTLFAIHNSGTCRMSTLAEITQQSAGTLTGIVDRLIDDGLVARVRNAADRRVVEVTLTNKGESRLQSVLNVRYADMEVLLNHFEIDDLDNLEHLLARLLHSIQSESEVVLEREVEA
jgi:DNA-binding MarR family transcriptional regulator